MKAERITAEHLSQITLKAPPAAAISFMASPYDALRWNLEDDEDDLDHFKVAYFLVDGTIFAEVVRYDGNPADTYTISVDRGATDDVLGVAKHILTEQLEMPESVIDWSCS